MDKFIASPSLAGRETEPKPERYCSTRGIYIYIYISRTGLSGPRLSLFLSTTISSVHLPVTLTHARPRCSITLQRIAIVVDVQSLESKPSFLFRGGGSVRSRIRCSIQNRLYTRSIEKEGGLSPEISGRIVEGVSRMNQEGNNGGGGG